MIRMTDRTSRSEQESCRLPPRSATRRQRLAIDQPIKSQATFGNIVTAVYNGIVGEQKKPVKKITTSGKTQGSVVNPLFWRALAEGSGANPLDGHSDPVITPDLRAGPQLAAPQGIGENPE
jgi:hypothetical protein